MKKGISYSLLFFFLALPCIVRAQTPAETLRLYFKDIATGKYNAIPATLSLAENARSTLQSIRPFLADTSAAVRARAHAIVQLTGQRSRQPAIREEAVLNLTKAIRDPHYGNAGLALGYLETFTRGDFNPTVRDTLVQVFKRKAPHYDKLIKLVGFLELTIVRDDLRMLAQQSNGSRQERWAAILALARMGDSFATDDVMKRVRKLPVNDEVVNQIFPDLVYTRTKEALDYLVEVLNSDALNCESSHMESASKIPCAFRVMEMLATAIGGYPVSRDSSGDLQSDNYGQTLQQIRQWFKENKEYKIVKEIY
jgi:hypothetical protein